MKLKQKTCAVCLSMSILGTSIFPTASFAYEKTNLVEEHQSNTELIYTQLGEQNIIENEETPSNSENINDEPTARARYKWGKPSAKKSWIRNLIEKFLKYTANAAGSILAELAYQGIGSALVQKTVLGKGYTTSGVSVKVAQKYLNGYGYSLDVDGSYGSKTKDAVKRFQTSKGLSADGFVGPKTWNALAN